MPDGATHLLFQIIFNNFVGLKKLIPYSLFGAIAPDLLKGFNRFLTPNFSWAFYPTHSPIFMLIVFYAFSLLFHMKERKKIIFGCMLGMLIHLFLDLFQINLGGGHYMPFFPISFYNISFGVFKTEASIFFLPVMIIFTLVIVRLKKNKT